MADATVTPAKVTDILEQTLRVNLKRVGLEEDSTTRYVAGFVDLDGTGASEALVYLIGQRWCGSGGCPLFVLAQHGSLFRVVTRVSVAQLPIRVLTEKTNGWRNIGVYVRGGGIEHGYESVLRFNGKTYPTNPTLLPARPLAGGNPGEIVISTTTGAVPLYH